MGIVAAIEQVREWTERKICEGTRLKVPAEYTAEIMNASNYEYEEVIDPACYAMFTPSAEKLPPDAKPPIPSVCVSLLEGEEYKLRLRLDFSTWSPGNYGKDILVKDPDTTAEMRYRPVEEMENEFTLYADAWRDVWNWIDKGLRALQNTKHFGNGIYLDMSEPIRYGPYKEQEAIVDLFPFWAAWITFTVKMAVSETRYDPELEEFL